MEVEALDGIGEVAPGDDLGRVIGAAIRSPLRAGDVLVVAQKVVSKAEGRLVRLADVAVTPRAVDLARVTGKDARLVQLILSEATEVVRAAPNVLIVRHRLGLVMANAGIDQSNIALSDKPPSTVAEGDEAALLLPLDPDASARALRDGLAARLGVAPAVVISDSFGRAWRVGTVNVAIGAAGLPSLIDLRGAADRSGRLLRSSEVAFADAVAAAAGLVMGEAGEGRPAVLVRGLSWTAPDRDAQALIRPLAQDLFR
jgi:coenzyme F420-0:L-glutamate ligase/coenzyme F420-1:gamma-L-glutamate ligase